MTDRSHIDFDIISDFSEDSSGRDPDIYSPTLRNFHLALWGRERSGDVMLDLSPVDIGRGRYLRLHAGEGDMTLSSDLIVTSARRQCPAFYERMGTEANIRFHNVGRSIGGRIVFPSVQIGRAHTINQARGTHPRIRDRFDLTLECIRRQYVGEENPLSVVLARYEPFFRKFGTFDTYVAFFLLDDLVDENFSVRFFLPFDGFRRSALPQSSDEYRQFHESQIRFVSARNARMLQAVSTA